MHRVCIHILSVLLGDVVFFGRDVRLSRGNVGLVCGDIWLFQELQGFFTEMYGFFVDIQGFVCG